MRIPDRTGVIAGYRVWRVIPGKWVTLSESLYAQSSHRSWSLAGPTLAYCPPRVQVDPNKPLLVSGCESAPSFGCTCGLYARYEPIREEYLLPHVVGSVLAWGRVVHHEERSFFRAEKALPIAFVRPRGGGGMYTREEAEDKFFRVAELLGAEVVGGPEELRKYTEEEASWW
jgi:hypothetical protein